MKNLFFFVNCLLVLAACALPALAQKSCCSVSAAPEAFAALGSDQSFRDAHENPLPYRYQQQEGSSITFQAMDGKEARGFEIKPPVPTNNYLLVFHEFWGLNDYVKKESARLAKELGNVNVLALDLYDGKTGATREEATQLMQAIDSKRAVAIIEGAARYAGSDAKIATIGWCFGGSWSLQAALHADQQAVGCVMFYGKPETNIERLSDLDCSVLGIFASQDKWITPKVVEQFRHDMKKAGKQLIVHMFDADHGFANPSNPKFQQKQSQEANAVALQYLRTAFGAAK